MIIVFVVGNGFFGRVCLYMFMDLIGELFGDELYGVVVDLVYGVIVVEW